MAEPRPRPMSPHLDVYRWRPNMLVSILHRVTGNGMATVGVLILLAWLLSGAAGAPAYAAFHGYATSPVGLLILFGLSWFFFQHLLSGLRHLYMDAGNGMQPAVSRQLASATLVGSTLLTVAVWAYIFLG